MRRPSAFSLRLCIYVHFVCVSLFVLVLVSVLPCLICHLACVFLTCFCVLSCVCPFVCIYLHVCHCPPVRLLFVFASFLFPPPPLPVPSFFRSVFTPCLSFRLSVSRCLQVSPTVSRSVPLSVSLSVALLRTQTYPYISLPSSPRPLFPLCSPLSLLPKSKEGQAYPYNTRQP